MKMTDFMDRITKLYVNEVIRLHRISISIILDWDLRFSSRLCPSIQHALGIKLHLSMTFHPRTVRKDNSNFERFAKILYFRI